MRRKWSEKALSQLMSKLPMDEISEVFFHTGLTYGQYWVFYPSPNTFSYNPSGCYYLSGAYYANNIFEPRIWDNGNPNSFTYQIQWQGVS